MENYISNFKKYICNLDKNNLDKSTQAFKLFDKDGDGLVTLAELMSLIKKASKANFHRWLGRCDS